MSFFNGKVVAVTGGASGIGKATCEILLKEGAKVYIADLNISGAEELKTQYGDKVVAIQTDVSKLESVKEFFGTVAKSGDLLYGAVNAAGINLPGKRLHETTDEFYEKTKGVNFDGVWYSMREELKIMMEHKKGGSIVNLSSGAGIAGMRNAATYCGTKHAVTGLTKATAMEYASENIRINAVAPGTSRPFPTDTRCHRHSSDERCHRESRIHETCPQYHPHRQDRATCRSRKLHHLPLIRQSILHHRQRLTY
jgi:NAD(P)-dependent dehydrogenase (short-subunit alcohol dehydrogenase family)